MVLLIVGGLMKKYFKYIKGNWIYTILAPIFIIFDALCSVIQPFLMGKIIDVGIGTRDVSYILKMGSLMVGVGLVALICGFLCMYFSAKASYGFAAHLREALLDKIEDFSFSNINKFKTSSLITRLTNDVTVVSNLFQMLLRVVVRAPFMFLGGTILAFTINKKLTLILFLMIPFLAVIVLLVLKFVSPLFQKVQKNIDDVNAVIRENLKGARVIKSFVREDYQKERFLNVNNSLRNVSVSSYGKIIMMSPIISFVMNVLIAVFVWLGTDIILQGDLDIGLLSSLILYVTIILGSLVMMCMTFMNFARARASSKRIFEVLDEKVDIVDHGTITKIDCDKITYDIDHFSFLDSSFEVALSDIHFSVSKGDKVAIIGGTGSGKSTLIHLLPRFYDVLDGAVLIDDIDVREYDLKTLRDAIGMVLQENRLFRGTIRENILWGKEDATDEELVEACKIAQIHDYIVSLPDGYDTVIEQKGSNFSGGQKQRLCIARALIKKPKILILDDSVSALDATTEGNLTKALREKFQDITIFIITQRISSCKNADYVVLMDQGHVLGIGTHEELLKNSSLYQEIHQSQMEVI